MVVEGKCEPQIEMCVDDKMADGICLEYCDQKCRSCSQTKTNCTECADFYVMNDDGACVIESKALEVIKDVRPLINAIKRRGFKWIFMMVDGLWLYQYHQQQYDGILRDIFKTIAFLEEKQWEVVGLADRVDELKQQINSIKLYNPYSNYKFMEETRNNNLLVDNLMDFLLLSVPLILAMEFLYYRAFYCLFNY